MIQIDVMIFLKLLVNEHATGPILILQAHIQGNALHSCLEVSYFDLGQFIHKLFKVRASCFISGGFCLQPCPVKQLLVLH